MLAHLGAADIRHFLFECITGKVPRVLGGDEQEDRAIVHSLLECALIILHSVSSVLKISECGKASKTARLNEVQYIDYGCHILAGIGEEYVALKSNLVNTALYLSRLCLKLGDKLLLSLGAEALSTPLEERRGGDDIFLLQGLDNKVYGKSYEQLALFIVYMVNSVYHLGGCTSVGNLEEASQKVTGHEREHLVADLCDLFAVGILGCKRL